uniref:Aquaporin n=1 Tax=Parascaris equorum TaxID=6256 RepID=A0A914RQG2_PAREQ
MLRTDIDFGPIFIATSFYLTVFVIAELTRKIVDRLADCAILFLLTPSSSAIQVLYVAYNTRLYYFFIEAVATSQMCACVYENAVIIRHYGPMGFFFAVTSVLFAGGFTNRGAFVSPLKPIEMFYHGSIGFDRLLSVVAGEALGGYSAYRVARQLWYWSLNIAADHAINYGNTRCAFAYKSSVRYATPAVTSAFLTFSLAYIGVSGLNPTVASSRMHGCDGLSTQWFILTYWVCPTVGWMLSTIVDSKWKALISRKEE